MKIYNSIYESVGAVGVSDMSSGSSVGLSLTSRVVVSASAVEEHSLCLYHAPN